MGGNKHFPHGVHYPGAMLRVAIIWEYTSVVNIILWGNSLSASCPRANYLGNNFRFSNFRGQLPGGQLSWGAIILGGNCPGVNYLGGAIILGAIIQGAIVLFPYKYSVR